MSHLLYPMVGSAVRVSRAQRPGIDHGEHPGDVSIDGGKSWGLAALQDPVLPMCTTRFRFPWFWDGQAAVLQSRCVDETGYVQPTRKRLAEVRGFAYHYHNNGIQSWGVAADGSVSNVWI